MPAPSYRVDNPVPLSDTHNGSPGAVEMPHGFRKFGSVWAARPGMFETRFVWMNPLSRSCPSAPVAAAGPAMPVTTAPAVHTAATNVQALLVRIMAVLPSGGDGRRRWLPAQPKTLIGDRFRRPYRPHARNPGKVQPRPERERAEAAIGS